MKKKVDMHRVANCSRGSCHNLADHFCTQCKRAFCTPCWEKHQATVHKDDALEGEVLSNVLEQMARLSQPGARRVLKDVARQVGLRYLWGTGKVR